MQVRCTSVSTFHTVVLRWRYPKKSCRRKHSIRHGSWFSCHHLTLAQVLTITFLWCENLEQHTITQWAGVNKATTVDWCNYLRKDNDYSITDSHYMQACGEYLERVSEPIGGPGTIVVSPGPLRGRTLGAGWH